MGEQKKRDDGGDISSGYGESEVIHPVSDEKAEKMLYGDRAATSGEDEGGEGGDTSGQGR